MLNRDREYSGVVVQSYPDERDADRAVRALLDAGFTSDDISVVARDRERAEAVADDTGEDVATGAGIGAVTGGVLGGIAGLFLGASALAIPGVGVVLAGPLATILGTAGAGAVTGGISGALAGLGVSKDDAEEYGRRLEAGDILVVVAAGPREEEARRILFGDRDRTITLDTQDTGYRTEG